VTEIVDGDSRGIEVDTGKNIIEQEEKGKSKNGCCATNAGLSIIGLQDTLLESDQANVDLGVDSTH
jgi:hypothetical protein